MMVFSVMADKVNYPNIVKKVFPEAEWEFLKHNPDFFAQWERCATTEDVKRLCTLGARLVVESDHEFTGETPPIAQKESEKPSASHLSARS